MIAKRADPAIGLLFCDQVLLAINKPAGLLSLPDGYDLAIPHAANLLEPRFGSLWVVHRLDRHASGVLLLARSADAHRELNRQFEGRRVVKLYHALVVGDPAWQVRTIRLPLRIDGDRLHRTVIDIRNGKPASTHFRVMERFGRYTLVEASPHTGRRHQIRAHLAAAGHPIIADGLYGDGRGLYLSELKPGFQAGRSEECPLLGRLGLHAWSLTFEHPLQRFPMVIEAPYPKDFSAALRQLRRYPVR